MLKSIQVDLHIHTCLSPCATLDMTPQKIVKESLKKNLSIIAITDHNSAQNVDAVIRVARNSDLYVIPGIEVTTSEEAHVIALFETVEAAISMQNIIFDHLLPGENDENLFGMQVIANEFDEVEGFNNRLLIGSTTLNINRVVSSIHQYGGLAIASHIDRESFSIIGQLGFIPEDLECDALEISRRMKLHEARIKFREYKNYSFIVSSDAHDLVDIGVCSTSFFLEHATFDEIRKAIEARDGRMILDDLRD